MKELLEYRRKLIEQIAAAAKEFRSACEAAKDPFAPVDEGGWNAHQLASHTRDADKHVYGMRVRRTINEENPEFKNFDANEWMLAHYNSSEPLEVVLDEFTASIQDLVILLRGLPSEAWNRESRHETLGAGFTTQTWVERGLAHIEEHLASVQKITRKT
ncbi:MAG: DinB family protein [Chloroflexi bacterium]|nr:DinB family protein [Chloroflexota bacterium]